MADGNGATTLGGLRNSKGLALAGVAALSVAALLQIAAKERRQTAALPPSSLMTSSIVVAQAQAQAQMPAPSAPAAAPATSTAGKFTSDQVKALHAIIKDYLMTNPEVLAEVSQALEKKQAADQAAKAEKYLAENKGKVFTTASDFVLGNPKGDVTVVEFFDYNCGWCKRAVADLITLTKSDPKVRVVLKEYPIFGGPPSMLAAKAAMASIRQGKYWEYHAALMREKQVTEANVFTVAEKVGLNVARLRADMADAKIDRAIEENIQVGNGLGIEGTPGFIVDSRVNVGYVPADGIKQMLTDIRKAGCKMC